MVGGGERTRWQGRALGQGREGPLEANLSAGAVRLALMQASAPAHSSLLPSAAASDCESVFVLATFVRVRAQGPSPLLEQIHFTLSCGVLAPIYGVLAGTCTALLMFLMFKKLEGLNMLALLRSAYGHVTNSLFPCDLSGNYPLFYDGDNNTHVQLICISSI